MKRKLLSVVLATAMVASLAACGGSSTTETTAAAADATTAAGTETTAAEASSDAEKFVIGGLGPLTGAAASYGLSVKQGSEVAISEINGKGGVTVGDKQYQLELNFLDDEASEETAVTAYNTLMDSGINALLGNVTSGACMAVTDLTKEDGILQITPSGSAADITKNDNVFRLCFTDPLQGVTIADYVVKQGYESVAVLYNNADEYSTGITDSFKAELEAQGKSDLLIDEESFGADDNDFSTQLTKIKASGAKLIFVPAYYDKVAYITKQAKDAGIEADFVGSDGWDGVIAQSTDTTSLEGAVFLSPFLASDPDEKVATFVDTYKSAYGSDPDQFAADGYDTVYVIAAAMEKAGSIDSDALIKAMTEVSVSGLTGDVTFDAAGEPSKGAKYVQIVDGEYTAFDID